MKPKEERVREARLAYKKLHDYRASLLKEYAEYVESQRYKRGDTWHDTIPIRAECELIERLLEHRQ